MHNSRSNKLISVNEWAARHIYIKNLPNIYGPKTNANYPPLRDSVHCNLIHLTTITYTVYDEYCVRSVYQGQGHLIAFTSYLTYILQYKWDAITCPCPSYLPLTQQSSYPTRHDCNNSILGRSKWNAQSCKSVTTVIINLAYRVVILFWCLDGCIGYHIRP